MQQTHSTHSTVLGLAGVAHVHANGVRALDHVDLKVSRAEFLTFIGPSGCGKSTLLLIAASLVAPTSGKVTRADDDATAFVFQSATLMPWADVPRRRVSPHLIAGSSDEQDRTDQGRGNSREEDG